MQDMIDFVVTWVNGSDESWIKERARYLPQTKEQDLRGVQRYRDWDLMRYWFRGVEKYASWVHKIYFITCGQKPEWLNLDCPKLKLIKHSDYMPKDALPTFNSNAIEMRIHNIKGLSENFVLFNDDFFIIDEINPDIFFKNGNPCDYAAFDALTPNQDFEYIRMNNVKIINQNFTKRKVLQNNFRKWFNLKDIKSLYRTLVLLKPWNTFTGFRDYHGPIAYCKKSFEELWEIMPELLEETVYHRFRTKEDYSHWLFRYWRNAKGEFVPQSQKMCGYFVLKDDDCSKAYHMIAEQKKKILCINDEFYSEDYQYAQSQLKAGFEKILSQKSTFEI